MSTTTLAQRMLAVSGELGWIDKSGKNKEQNYDFVRAVDVFDRARDALNKHGVVWAFSTRDHEIVALADGKKFLHKLTGDYTLINADDPKDTITGSVEGSTIAYGDKGVWVATTGMLKYALIQLFLLPTGDDPEAQPEEEGKVERKPAEKAPSAPSPIRKGLTEPQKGKLFATFDRLGIKATESRRHVLLKVIGKNSTKDMTGDDLDMVLQFFAEPNEETEALVVEAMAKVADK